MWSGDVVWTQSLRYVQLNLDKNEVEEIADIVHIAFSAKNSRYSLYRLQYKNIYVKTGVVSTFLTGRFIGRRERRSTISQNFEQRVMTITTQIRDLIG